MRHRTPSRARRAHRRDVSPCWNGLPPIRPRELLMNEPAESGARGYDDLYQEFESPLTQQIRREAHGEDIGQHSWVSAEELRQDISRLGLSGASRLLDLGFGPCGPLTFVVRLTGCHGTGVDMSAPAIAPGPARAASPALE